MGVTPPTPGRLVTRRSTLSTASKRTPFRSVIAENERIRSERGGSEGSG
jgi:hypothetical protein